MITLFKLILSEEYEDFSSFKERVSYVPELTNLIFLSDPFGISNTRVFKSQKKAIDAIEFVDDACNVACVVEFQLNDEQALNLICFQQVQNLKPNVISYYIWNNRSKSYLIENSK